MTRAFLLVLALVLVSLTGVAQVSASCFVSRQCWDGSAISCTGNTCSSGPGGANGTGWVQCDSNQTILCPFDCASAYSSGTKNGVCDPQCVMYDWDCCVPDFTPCSSSAECGVYGTCNSSHVCICRI